MFSMGKITNEWISGFFDGEGSVQLRIQRVNYSFGFRYVPCLSVSQLSKNDWVLKDIEAFLNENDIKTFITEKNRSNGRSNTTEMGVVGHSNCREFIELLEGDIILKKKEIEIMRDKILPAIDEGKHLDRGGFMEILDFKSELDSHKGGNRSKYDKKYFQEKWEIEPAA